MYLALYRKYRPTTFDDVISQPHITTTLKNQIMGGKHGHAYLFTGSRGTGKTTCAKILSMAVNCLHPIDGNPCMECEACREIASGSAVDITEMDAASNNGVNDVRVLRDEVMYTPISCKYRVYIIDEVHMMSTAAFNALLKTLEEPPAHVIFILATTELHKVPATIVSRCQRFEFRRIDIAESAKRLMSVAATEGISLDYDAAELISRLSDGGMRDALSVLDRCIAAEGNVTCDTVRSCAGVADNRHLYKFAEMIAAKDISGCLNLMQELYNASKDLARLVDELSGCYRDLMLYKTVPEDKNLLSAMPDEYPEIERISALYSLADILRCLELLQKCADGIGRTRHRKTSAEMTLVRMCLGSVVPDGALQSVPQRQMMPAATAPVPKPTMEDFTPIPDEKLSPAVKAIREKTRAISERNTAPANIPEAEQSAIKAEPPVLPAESAPLPQFDSAAAMIEDYAPPLPEPPPEDYAQPVYYDIPQQDYAEEQRVAPPMPAEAPVPIEEKAPVADTAQPEASAEEAEKAEELVPKREKLSGITQDYWESCVELMPVKTGIMLSNSTVSVDGEGVLEIHTTSRLLLTKVDKEGYGELEAEIRKVMGKNIRVKVVENKSEQTAEEKHPAVKQLLEKARKLGIETIIK